MATFLANKINSTGADITGRAAHVQIMFPVKDMVFGDIFSATHMNKQSKKFKTCVI